jgi:hypothetical protein
MKQKLTLSIEPEVVLRVKRVARERNTTVSSLFEDWGSRVFLKESSGGESNLGDALRGRWVLPENKTVDDIRMDYLLRKHGKSDARAG